MKRRKKIILGIAAVLCIILGGCFAYLNDYYRADMVTIEAFNTDNVVKMENVDGMIVAMPEETKAGMIFYPGGKVECTAYIPLMKECASKGIMCVLVEMPFNLAVLDVNAAEGIQQQYEEVENWYMGGHSLGGSMAASYLEKHEEEFEGLILLGSYSTADLSGSELDVLSIYGSEDGVMNQTKYEDNKENLPSDYSEVILEGGCHAYFGVYGEQEGDGSPTISHKEQIEKTAEAIYSFCTR